MAKELIDVMGNQWKSFSCELKLFFSSFRYISKTGHSVAQNRQRDDILKHFIGLTADSRLKKRIKDRSEQPRQDICCTFIHFSSVPVLGITDLQHNSSRLRPNAHHIACRVSIRYLNKIIVPDVIVTRSLFILWA